LLYGALKNRLPFSNKFIKNKRVFNEKDLEMVKFYKVHGLEKTLLDYGTEAQKTETKTVSKPFLDNQKQFLNDLPDSFKQSLMDELETVKKQFEDKENGLKLEIGQKDKIIGIREEQTQKYALLKMEEQKEKELWIKKYEAINQEKTEWIKKFYSLKTYLVVFIVLFLLSVVALIEKSI
jgi:hypothetical protein